MYVFTLDPSGWLLTLIGGLATWGMVLAHVRMLPRHSSCTYTWMTIPVRFHEHNLPHVGAETACLCHTRMYVHAGRTRVWWTSTTGMARARCYTRTERTSLCCCDVHAQVEHGCGGHLPPAWRGDGAAGEDAGTATQQQARQRQGQPTHTLLMLCLMMCMPDDVYA